MDPRSLHEDDWDYVRTLLPTDLEDSARLTQALRRCRNVPDAAALIRMALAYALTDLSLKDVAAWASSLNLEEITGPGLFYRDRKSTRLNSMHLGISYAVFCLKKKESRFGQGGVVVAFFAVGYRGLAWGAL